VNSSFVWTLELSVDANSVNHPPYFATQLEQQTVYAGETATYSLPEATDSDSGQTVSVRVDLSSCSSFTKYSKGLFTFQPSPN